LASTIAFLLALLVAGFFYTRSARAHSDFKELLGILIAGWLGAAILFLAAGLLSRGATQWREAVALAVKWAPVGALVASFAYPVRRIPEWFPIAWEVVVAMAIAWVLPEKTPEPPSGSG
jgi:hypothetical protein